MSYKTSTPKHNFRQKSQNQKYLETKAKKNIPSTKIGEKLLNKKRNMHTCPNINVKWLTCPGKKM